MKPVALCLFVLLLCGCAPEGKAPWSAPSGPAAKAAPLPIGINRAQAAAPLPSTASYEVSIASAEADRIHARDLCDSKPKEARGACLQAADAAYDQAKSAADNADDTAR